MNKCRTFFYKFVRMKLKKEPNNVKVCQYNLK